MNIWVNLLIGEVDCSYVVVVALPAKSADSNCVTHDYYSEHRMSADQNASFARHKWIYS